MPRKKKFAVRLEVLLPMELHEFLKDMVSVGEAETVSHAVRRCIRIAKKYMPVKTKSSHSY